MTPKEKSIELMNKFNNYHNTELKEYIIYQSLEESKRCALIAIDEILNNCLFEIYNCGFLTLETKHKEYWKEVKQEINKL